MPRPTVNSAGVYPNTVTASFQNGTTSNALNVGACTNGLFQASPGARPNLSSGTQIGTIYMIGFFHLAGSAPTLASPSVVLTGDTLPLFAARVVVDTSVWQLNGIQIPTTSVWTRDSGTLHGTPYPVSQSKMPLSFVSGDAFDASGTFLWN